MIRQTEHTDAKELLEAWNITQRQVADDVGCSYQLVNLVLNGYRADRKGILESVKRLARQAKRKEEVRKNTFADLMPAA